MTSLSVIIPCFDEAQTISELIDAVEKTPGPSKEIIIVDDCSTDSSLKIIKKTNYNYKFVKEYSNKYSIKDQLRYFIKYLIN